MHRHTLSVDALYPALVICFNLDHNINPSGSDLKFDVDKMCPVVRLQKLLSLLGQRSTLVLMSTTTTAAH